MTPRFTGGVAPVVALTERAPLQHGPTVLPYAPAAEAPAEAPWVEYRPGGVTVTVPALSPGRRFVRTLRMALVMVIGPLAAAMMIAAAMGWLGRLVALALILSPAAVIHLLARHGAVPPAPSDAVFELDATGLSASTRGRQGWRTFRWAPGTVVSVRAELLGDCLCVRATDRDAVELLHGQSLKVRARVARILEGAMGRAGG